MELRNEIAEKLTNKAGKGQKVNTIWKLKPKGKIELITPYSGHSY